MGVPVLRLATTGDLAAVGELMRRSVLDLFPLFHDARQTASAARYLTSPDSVLVEDGTYFVHEVDGAVVSCGGWSRRDKLHAGALAGDNDERVLDPATEPARVRAMFVDGGWTRRGLAREILARCERDARAAGFRGLVLMATLPGVPLYRAYGFRDVAATTIRFPDGVTVGGVSMEYSLG